MKLKEVFKFVLLAVAIAFMGNCSSDVAPKIGASFESDIAEHSAKPWSDKTLRKDGKGILFAVFSDRTGFHYPGKTKPAVEKINRSSPNFVISIGDQIEGYTRDLEVIDRQWTEFDTLIAGLESRYFSVPGNHDYANHVMAEYYKKRNGRDYYYFVFKEALFLCLNTQDPPPERPEGKEKKKSDWIQSMNELIKKDPQKGIASLQKTLKQYSTAHGHASISDAQVEYFKDVLARHKAVKWTFLFMHMPAWDEAYKCENFNELQQALKGRAYTVFAGHEHRYRLEIVDKHEYYRLGPTAAVPRDNIPECENQFLIVDFRREMPRVQVVKVDEG